MDKVKTMMVTAIGGAMTLAVVLAVNLAMITGTDSGSTLWLTLSPILIGVGFLIAVIVEAFTMH